MNTQTKTFQASINRLLWLVPLMILHNPTHAFEIVSPSVGAVVHAHTASMLQLAVPLQNQQTIHKVTISKNGHEESLGITDLFLREFPDYGVTLVSIRAESNRYFMGTTNGLYSRPNSDNKFVVTIQINDPSQPAGGKIISGPKSLNYWMSNR